MLQTAVFPSRYVQARGAIASLGAEVARLGSNAFFIAGRSATRQLVPVHQESWKEQLTVTIEHFEGECSDPEIERLSALVRDSGANVVVGLGGGKAIDTAKAVAHACGCRLVVVPTIASTDAPTSALSVIYTPEGEFARYLFLPRNRISCWWTPR